MKKYFKRILAVIMSLIMALTMAAVPMAATAADANEEKNYAEGEAIVVLNAGLSQNFLRAANATSTFGKGIKIKKSFTFKGSKKYHRANLNIAVLKSNTLTTKQLIGKLRKNKAVRFAVPNRRFSINAITDDTYSKYQWALENTGMNGGTAGSDINADALWDKASASETEQVVAICDTGIDLENPEFEGILWDNPYGSKLYGEHGFDFSGVNEDCKPQDGNGHGTHCAGIIAAAADNQKGISGVNKANVKIMPVKWLDDDGSGWTEDVISAYEYIQRAMDLGTNVVAVSNSWGGAGMQEEVELFDMIFDMFGEKGAISVVAAGNESTDIGELQVDDFWGDEFYTIPAYNNSNYAITVAASNVNDELADFSNYSDKFVDVAAPGTDILSTVSYNCFNPSIYSDEKKAAIIDKMQTYDAAVTPSDFGYPVVKTPQGKCEDVKIDKYSENLTVSASDNYFGFSGGSIKVTSNDEIKKDKAYAYVLSVPFTVTDETKDYALSFMVKCDKSCAAVVYDAPADFNILENFETAYVGGQVFGGYDGKDGNYWSHYFLNSSFLRENDLYEESNDRQLAILFLAYESGASFCLDDFAISKGGTEEAEYEKYDFYNGTSMATPYVAGAVALVRNAYPDADVLDVVNMVKNTGRSSATLEGLTATGKVLSLDTVENTPPMIFSIGYNEQSDIEISGSLKDVSEVKVNGAAVTPKSKDEHTIVIPDNNYSTYKTEVTVTNPNGSDTDSFLITDKTPYELTDTVSGQPYGFGGTMLPAGDKAYYVDAFGNIGCLIDCEDGTYFFNEYVAVLDGYSLFDDYADENINIIASVYFNAKIYFVALRPILTSTGVEIGCENAFGYVDLETGDTVYLCEIPEEISGATTLAAYKGELYMLGGFDGKKLIDTVYKYNEKDACFDKASFKLPEARAYGKFLQFGDRLVGAFGTVEDGSLPKFISFDGTEWKSFDTKLDCDDYDVYTDNAGKEYKVYLGNIGYGKNGVFFNGPYIYGKGDSYTYNPVKNTLTASEYAYRFALEDERIIGTTLRGCFIGYPEQEEWLDDDDDDEYYDRMGYTRGFTFGDADDNYDNAIDDIDVDIEDETYATAYRIEIKNSYPVIDDSELFGAFISLGWGSGYLYGDKVSLELEGDRGYAVTSISIDGKVVSKSNKADIVISKPKVKITATTKLVAPAKIKDLKAALKGKTATLTWSKPKRAKGYQVQKLVKGRWKTVKTIKKAKTCKYVAKKLKGTVKFRVRAYNTYKGKRYNGAWSKPVSVKA